jgi:uncharacterized membrane protein YraQ (UPF0718 family)
MIEEIFNGLMTEAKKIPYTALSAALLWFVAWGTAFYVYPRLAQATEVQTITQQVSMIQLQLLEKDIVETKVQQCTSQNKRFFEERLANLMRQYRDIAKSTPKIPSCGDV